MLSGLHAMFDNFEYKLLMQIDLSTILIVSQYRNLKEGQYVIMSIKRYQGNLKHLVTFSVLHFSSKVLHFTWFMSSSVTSLDHIAGLVTCFCHDSHQCVLSSSYTVSEYVGDQDRFIEQASSCFAVLGTCRVTR